MRVRRSRLLIVGLGPADRDPPIRYLEQEGHTVIVAEDGRQALHMIEEEAEQFDLVLLDATLPEKDGYEVLERSRIGQTAVVVVTPANERQRATRYIERGADDYLSMPLDPVSLQTRLAASLEKGQLREQAEEYRLQLEQERKYAHDLLHVVIPIGIALSAERDFNRLLEMILLEGKSLCNADGGTLYLRTEDDHLAFVIVRNDSLDMVMGGTTGKEITFPPLPMFDATTGEPNHHNVATHSALSGASVNIADAYQVDGFDFSGTRAFDKKTGYRSTSFLTIPLKNAEGYVIGVIQLINAQDPETGAVIPFSPGLQSVLESLSSLATVALEAYIREQSLRKQIEELRIEIDEARKIDQVAEITESEYFQSLQKKAKRLKAKPDTPDE